MANYRPDERPTPDHDGQDGIEADGPDWLEEDWDDLNDDYEPYDPDDDESWMEDVP